jgi:hypothetical protein
MDRLTGLMFGTSLGILDIIGMKFGFVLKIISRASLGSLLFGFALTHILWTRKFGLLPFTERKVDLGLWPFRNACLTVL